MDIHTDIAIVGGGIMGASLSYYLTKLGTRKVTLCEQGIPPGIGATLKSGGFIRIYHENEWYTRTALKSYTTYINWNEIIGGDCGFQKTGFSYIVNSKDYDELEKKINRMKQFNIPTQLLSPEQFHEIQPNYQNNDIRGIAYEANSGYANPAKATIDLIQRSRDYGMQLLEGVQVRKIELTQGRITGLSTNIGNIYAEKYVIANNIWAKPLLNNIGIDIPIFSKNISVGFMECREENLILNMTSYIDRTINTYFRPDTNNRILVGMEPRLNFSSYSKTLVPNYKELKKARDKISTRIKSIGNCLFQGGRVSFDSYTDDGLPVIGKVGAVENLYTMVGLNGSGFKIAPSIGSSLAKELITGNPSAELNCCSPNRFKLFK